MKFDKKVYQTLTLITQFGINMLVPIFFCSFIGIFLDKKLETNFIVIILFFIGAISGGYNVYKMSKRYLKKDDPFSAYSHGRKATSENTSKSAADNDKG